MKIKYAMALLLVAGCGHASIFSSSMELIEYSKTIPQLCSEQLSSGVFTKNMEGVMTCRKSLMMNKAQQIDFPNVPELEVAMNEQVDLGKKLDANQITMDEFLMLGEESNCKMIESFARSFKNLNRSSARMHDLDKNVGDKCRQRRGLVPIQQ